MTDPYRSITIAPGVLYVAPLNTPAPRGPRGWPRRLADLWRGLRGPRELGRDWVAIGTTTEGSSFRYAPPADYVTEAPAWYRGGPE